MTIHVPEELARFIEDAVRTGQYKGEADVIRDALTRLRQSMEATTAATDQSGKPVPQEKPLTKQKLRRHLEEIGLVDSSPDTSSDSEDADASLFDDEGEIISEVVVRERLIAWLVGFL
jgi:Arc/MetJ-type ribon-helix-helix transcriptional regulator